MPSCEARFVPSLPRTPAPSQRAMSLSRHTSACGNSIQAHARRTQWPAHLSRNRACSTALLACRCHGCACLQGSAPGGCVEQQVLLHIRPVLACVHPRGVSFMGAVSRRCVQYAYSRGIATCIPQGQQSCSCLVNSPQHTYTQIRSHTLDTEQHTCKSVGSVCREHACSAPLDHPWDIKC